MFAFDAVGVTLFDMPGYLFCVIIGTTVTISVYAVLLTAKGYSVRKNIPLLIPVTVCVILSARLAGCLSGIYRDIGSGAYITWEGIRDTGIVFYGGLFGLLGSYRFLSGRIGQDDNVMDVLAVSIPLFHFFARIGCFLGGCCYGVAMSGICSVTYTTIVDGELNTAERLPVQLFEAGFNLLLFLYLLRGLFYADWRQRGLLRKYLCSYSVGRFVLEFLRGDVERGVCAGVSFSQVICIVVWMYLLLTGRKSLARSHRKRRKLA